MNELMNDREINVTKKLSKAWKIASEKLGFRATTPYYLEYEQDRLLYVAFLPDFGGKNGALIGVVTPCDSIRARYGKAARERGKYFSAISADCCNYNYNEERFTDALIDWGYFGSEKNKPQFIKDIPDMAAYFSEHYGSRNDDK